LVNHSQQNSAATGWASHLFRSRITGTQELQFERGISDGTADGHWYLVESISGQDFTVEASDIQLSATTTGSDTVSVSAGELDNTFLLGSYMIDTAASATDYNTLDLTLSTNSVDALRGVGTDVIDWSGFVVKMLDGTLVERGIKSDWSQTASVTQSLTTVTSTDAMAILPGSFGSTVGGSFTGNGNSDVPPAFVGLDFSDSTTVRLQHRVLASENLNDVSWEVVQWDTGGAPPTRRVMVR
jgi:hypothetical protein